MKFATAFPAVLGSAMAFPQATTTTPPISLEATATPTPCATSPNISNAPFPTTATCTVTYGTLGNPFIPGLWNGTCSKYVSTVTSTHFVNCGGCALEKNNFYQGHGPKVPDCTTTEMVPSTVTWDWACASGTGMASVIGFARNGVEGGEGGEWDLGKDRD